MVVNTEASIGEATQTATSAGGAWSSGGNKLTHAWGYKITERKRS